MMMLRFNKPVLTSGMMVMLMSHALTALAQSDEGILLQLSDNLDEPRGICIDIRGYRDSLDLHVPVQAHTCKPDPERREDGMFVVEQFDGQSGTTRFRNPTYDVCLDVLSAEERGSIFVRKCSGVESQQFNVSELGEIRPVPNPGTCVTVSPSPSHPAVLAGTEIKPGVTFVARAMSLATCKYVNKIYKTWALPASGSR
jgi:hypothetical protein